MRPTGRSEIRNPETCREHTMSNVQCLKDLGYEVIIKWECEFDHELKNNENLRVFCKSLNTEVDNRHKLIESQIIKGVQDGSFFGMVDIKTV